MKPLGEGRRILEKKVPDVSNTYNIARLKITQNYETMSASALALGSCLDCVDDLAPTFDGPTFDGMVDRAHHFVCKIPITSSFREISQGWSGLWLGSGLLFRVCLMGSSHGAGTRAVRTACNQPSVVFRVNPIVATAPALRKWSIL